MNARNTQPNSLSDAIFKQLKEEINSLSLAPGSPLREVELAERFQTSRTPVREALLRLQAEGFVEITPGRGASVCSVSIREVLDAYEVREVLESYAALKAARNGVDQVKAQLLLDRLDRLSDEPQSADDMQEREDLDRDFHFFIVEQAGNAVIQKVIRDTRVLVSRVFGLLGGRDRFEQAKSEHQQTLQAIVVGDGERAAELMREHLHRSKARLFEMSEKTSERERPDDQSANR